MIFHKETKCNKKSQKLWIRSSRKECRDKAKRDNFCSFIIKFKNIHNLIPTRITCHHNKFPIKSWDIPKITRHNSHMSLKNHRQTVLDLIEGRWIHLMTKSSQKWISKTRSSIAMTVYKYKIQTTTSTTP